MTGVLSDLTGKVVVVTGGASGIGHAVANSCLALGAEVVIADLASTPPVDVTSTDSVRALAERVGAVHGRCDILIAAAGAVFASAPDALDDASWDRLFAVNVKGVWRVVDALLPLMPSGASIVAVASGAGLRPSAELSAYAATKGAVIAYTRALAVDLSPRGIRANCVAPGIVDTPMHRDAQQLRGAQVAAAATGHAQYLIKRDGTPEELAAAILMLATNGYITGTTLAVDGGRTMH
ncbi:SDR family NAD(P)-dependent oxidoreductase [Leucobacter komagatae]|uniref:NAD(P)-dependent dehydrogenase (Short-subunit alcohol dehydrogenase family) n=1 Tax=Leucobacter komagatae TaxID=55969 RepID=A0A0D0IJR2_9MICO|nr:SDR family oxidoreductase [Leucobacter komagatae]KIP51287.1 hypothetical protein SD72_16285 [Leucobacter komagatae]